MRIKIVLLTTIFLAFGSIGFAQSNARQQSDTPAKGGGLVNVTTSKVVGLNYVDL